MESKTPHNIKMSKKIIRENLRNLLLEKKGDTHDYGCVMFFFDISKKKWDETLSMIDDDDVYNVEGDKSYGIEDEPHVTLLYGLHDTIPDEKIKEISNKLEIIELKLKKISIFENEKFDVVKFDIIGDSKTKLSKINSEFAKLPHTTDYPDYHPHSTLFYAKKGKGKDYIKTLSDDDAISVTCKKVVYSKADGSKLTYKLK